MTYFAAMVPLGVILAISSFILGLSWFTRTAAIALTLYGAYLFSRERARQRRSGNDGA
jgi:hypothetical protein